MQANALYVERYNSRVTHAYQPQGFLLSGMFQPEAKFEGTKAYWPRYGAIEATDIVRHQDHAIANPDSDQIPADLKSWGVYLQNSDFDGERMSVNEEDAAVAAAAKAMGRRADKNALDVMKAVTFTAGDNFLDASAAQLKATDAMLLLSNWMGKNDITPDGMIFGAITMKAHQCLMGDSAYSNSQWVGGDLPFKQMGRTQGRSWNFVNWIIVPDTYLNDAATPAITDLLLWHKPAVGATSQMMGDVKSEWERLTRKQSWGIMHKASGANIAILPKGVAKLRMKADIVTIAKS
jgi:hypothetical protein